MPKVWKYLSAALSNISTNSQNRTKLYKAELEAKIVDCGKTSSSHVDVNKNGNESKEKGSHSTEEQGMNYKKKKIESAMKNDKKNKYLEWFEKR